MLQRIFVRKNVLYSKFFYFLVFLYSMKSVFSGNGSSRNQEKEFWDKLFDSYDSGVRPNHGGQPVVVGVTMYVLAITNIDEIDMTFTLGLYFRQSWKDPRLTFDPVELRDTGILNVGNTVDLYGDRKRYIWIPDTFIVNEVESSQHQAFVLNELIRVNYEGQVLKSGRYTVTTSCPMDLRYYPFDQQLCTLEIESFGATAESIRYKWDKGKNSVGVGGGIMPPTHFFIGHRQQVMDISLSTGNYSRLATEFLIGRNHGRFILKFFVPMILFVLVSLFSLWIASTKMGILINFFNICFINLFIGESSSDMPKISYHTTLDTYFIICIVHVAFCLLDSLIANYFALPLPTNQSIEMTLRRHEPMTDDIENLVGSQRVRSNDLKQQIAQAFNLFNLFIKSGLLITFGLSNLIFFIVCQTASQLSLDDFIPVRF